MRRQDLKRVRTRARQRQQEDERTRATEQDIYIYINVGLLETYRGGVRAGDEIGILVCQWVLNIRNCEFFLSKLFNFRHVF